jgi:hypothetical protein
MLAFAGLALAMGGYLAFTPQLYREHEMRGLGHLFDGVPSWNIRLLGILLIVFSAFLSYFFLLRP